MTGPVALLSQAFALYKTKFSSVAVLGIPLFLATVITSLVTAGIDPASASEVLATLPTLTAAAVLAGLVSMAIEISLIESAAGRLKGYLPPAKKFLAVLWTSVLAGLLVLIGLVFLIIPGIILMIRYALALPVVVLESARGMAALKRSQELVKGHWWGVLGRLIFVAVVTGLLSMLIGLPFGAAGDDPTPLGQVMLAAAAGFLTVPLGAFYTYFMYRDLESQASDASLA